MGNKSHDQLAYRLAQSEEMLRALRMQYKHQLRTNPFDSVIISHMRDGIKRQKQEVAQLRLELESYQLSFRFGS